MVSLRMKSYFHMWTDNKIRLRLSVALTTMGGPKLSLYVTASCNSAFCKRKKKKRRSNPYFQRRFPKSLFLQPKHNLHLPSTARPIIHFVNEFVSQVGQGLNPFTSQFAGLKPTQPLEAMHLVWALGGDSLRNDQIYNQHIYWLYWQPYIQSDWKYSQSVSLIGCMSIQLHAKAVCLCLLALPPEIKDLRKGTTLVLGFEL